MKGDNKILLDIRKKIRKKQLKIAVIGLGYVGFPLALEFAKKGIKVVGIEIDRDRLKAIENSSSYITDISNDQLRKALSSGNFKASGNFTDIKDADAILICVPTPLKGKYLPDISFIKNAMEAVAIYLKDKALVVL